MLKQGEMKRMYCTNCGAQVSPEEKFCMKCGAPVDASAVNVGAQNTGFGAGGQDDGLKGFNPQAANVAAPPKQKKVWPIVVAIVAVLLVISVAAGFAIKAIISKFLAKTEELTEEEIEEFVDGYIDPDDITEQYGIDDVDPDDFDFGDFEQFDVDEFIEQYGDYDEYSGGTDEFDFDTDDYMSQQYEYADAYYYSDYIYIEGRDAIKDSTVIYGGKTIGEFCDYVDKNVLEKGRKIDRDLLYDLLEVHLVDSSFIKDNTPYFEQSMVYCMIFANEFGNLNIDLEGCAYYTDEPTIYYYDVETAEREDTWIVDYTEKYVYMNEGNTEYTSAGEFSMFSDKTFALWLMAIDEFFEIG